jgi:hypothetical protein
VGVEFGGQNELIESLSKKRRDWTKRFDIDYPN